VEIQASVANDRRDAAHLAKDTKPGRPLSTASCARARGAQLARGTLGRHGAKSAPSRFLAKSLDLGGPLIA
jgi:hypothetical protein